jgi:hypothetical protein
MGGMSWAPDGRRRSSASARAWASIMVRDTRGVGGTSCQRRAPSDGVTASFTTSCSRRALGDAYRVAGAWDRRDGYQSIAGVAGRPRGEGENGNSPGLVHVGCAACAQSTS